MGIAQICLPHPETARPALALPLHTSSMFVFASYPVSKHITTNNIERLKSTSLSLKFSPNVGFVFEKSRHAWKQETPQVEYFQF